MALGKRIALKDYIEVDGTDISIDCKGVAFSSEHETVDVSGFNETGRDQTIPGKTIQSVTLQVFATSSTFNVLYHLHNARDVATFVHRSDMTLPVSSDNPELRGNVTINSWSPEATRGDVVAFPVTLTVGDENGFDYYET